MTRKPLLILKRIGYFGMKMRNRYLKIDDDGAYKPFLDFCIKNKDGMHRGCTKIEQTTEDELNWLVRRPEDGKQDAFPNNYNNLPEKQKDRRKAVIEKGNELEKQTEQLFMDVTDNNVRSKAVALFKRDWKTPDLKPYKKSNSRTNRTIRVCQFNILAHGLASPSAGFAYMFKPDAPKDSCYVPDGDKKSDIGDFYQNKKLLKAVMGEFIFNPNKDAKQFKNGYTMDAGKYYNYDPKDDKTVPKGDNNLEYYNTDGKDRLPMSPRLERALGIILRQSPDIITIQELDHFDDFQEILQKLGYEGMISKKKTDCPGAPYNGNNGPDGTAVFWNNTRFKLSNNGNADEDIYITPPKAALEMVKTANGTKVQAKLTKAIYDGKTLTNEAKCGSQRLLRVRLEDRKTKKPFAVLTGHFKSGSKTKDRPDQLIQAQQVIDLLREDMDKPVIFACDFNNNVYTDAFRHFWEEHNKIFQGDGLKSAYPLYDIRVGDYVIKDKAKVDQDFSPNDLAEVTTKKNTFFAQAAEVLVMDPEGPHKCKPDPEDEKEVEFDESIHVHVREVVAGKLVGDTHIVLKKDLKKVKLFKVKKIVTKNNETKAKLRNVSLYVTGKTDAKLKYKIGNKVKGTTNISDLVNRTRLSCVKWRRGGSQSAKINKVMETIDYIFSRGFETKAFLELPEVNEVLKATGGTGIPHLKYPSDHFMIAADLELQDGVNIRFQQQMRKSKKVEKGDYIKRFNNDTIPYLRRRPVYDELFKKLKVEE